jgi:S1-C subfamily serine protease
VTVEGTGPAFEQISIGTGFLVQPGLILTNLHVARPWWKDGIAEQLMGQGFQARMLRLNAYFPTARRPFRLEPAGDNATHDLALCRFLPGDLSVPPPPLAASDAPLNVGQTIVLLSYPAGIDALLGRLDEAVAQDVVNTTPSSRVTDVLRELATRGLIRPLPTQGHITALWPTRIVHDAPVASGSSGGPLLNREGVVVGISFAMVPEFGGSNYAIPINAVREFLRQQGVIP